MVVDRLTMTATALNQSGSTKWFNLAAVIQVKSKKPIEFILLTMRKLFLSETRIGSTRPIFCMATLSPTNLLIWWYTLNLQPTMNWGRYQYRCTGTGHMLWTQRQFYLRVYKEVVILAFCFSQKSGWIGRRAMIGRIIQRTFSITVLAMYSSSFLARLIYSKSLLPNLWGSEHEFGHHLEQRPSAIKFTYTYVSCVTTKARHH